MVNKIFCFFIIAGLLFSIITGNTEVISKEILNSTKTSFELVLQIFPVLALWLGLMNIASKSGLLNKLAYFLSPVLKKIFPDIPEGHESLGLISTNVITNIFGLGNASTPIGLKAMKSLQSINKVKDTASKSMITFLVLNTTGLTIIPTTIISLRIMYESINPTTIIFPCFIATLSGTIGGLILDKLFSKVKS